MVREFGVKERTGSDLGECWAVLLPSVGGDWEVALPSNPAAF